MEQIAANLPGNVVPANERCHNRQSANATKRLTIITQMWKNFWLARTLNRELETKGNCKQAENCQEKAPLQTSRENQRQCDQQPLEAEDEPKVLQPRSDGRVIDRITPVKELRHLGSTAPGAQKDHLWQCDQSCCNG